MTYERDTYSDETGEAIPVIVKTGQADPRFIELELVEVLMELRATDLDALEHVWSIAEAFLNRGRPLEAIES